MKRKNRGLGEKGEAGEEGGDTYFRNNARSLSIRGLLPEPGNF